MNLFPLDLDLLADLLDESLPWFQAWTMAVALLLGAAVVAWLGAQCKRSPVERLLRRDFR